MNDYWRILRPESQRCVQCWETKLFCKNTRQSQHAQFQSPVKLYYEPKWPTLQEINPVSVSEWIKYNRGLNTIKKCEFCACISVSLKETFWRVANHYFPSPSLSVSFNAGRWHRLFPNGRTTLMRGPGGGGWLSCRCILWSREIMLSKVSCLKIQSSLQPPPDPSILRPSNGNSDATTITPPHFLRPSGYEKGIFWHCPFQRSCIMSIAEPLTGLMIFNLQHCLSVSMTRSTETRE